jgi:hypothetical protein
MHHRRLLFLDETLYRVIHRFEEEYPECKQPLPTIIEPHPLAALNTAAAVPATQTNAINTEDQDLDNDDSPLSPFSTTNILKPPSRRGSEVSLHSKYLQDEEGQMHKLGQYMKTEIFAGDSPRQGAEEAIEAEEEGEARKAHRERILKAVEGLDGEELKRRIMEEEGGVDEYILKIEGEKKAARWNKDFSSTGGAEGLGVVLNAPPGKSVR